MERAGDRRTKELAGTETQDFAAGALEVWRYRLEFLNLPRYNPAVTEITLVTPGAGPGGDAGVGAAYHLTLQTEAGPHPVTMTVTGVEEGRRVDADMVGAMSANESFVVQPRPGGGCTAALTLWLELPPGLSAETTAQLLAGGRAQIRLELDHMAVELAGGDRRTD